MGAPQDREIFVTGHALDGRKIKAFKTGQKYKLRCGVGEPDADNLATGGTTVTDVPKGGLSTHWIVTSTEVRLVRTPDTASVHRVGRTWTGGFDLFIPEEGTSETKEIAFVAGAKAGTVHVTIYVVGANQSSEIYRELTIRLKGGVKLTADKTAKAMLHTHLRTTHEWTTPEEHIQVAIRDRVAEVSTKRVRLRSYDLQEPFSATVTGLKGAIQNVRDALEEFRVAHDAYLNDLDPADMASRLANHPQWQPHYCGRNGWQPLPDAADRAHRDAFATVVRSREWQALAHAGYALFTRCFKPQSKLRTLLDTTLPPGSRIDFHWTEESGPGYVPHVPWGLMYTEPVDVLGRKLANPEKFLGLQFQIGSRSWPVENGSVVLGGLDAVHSVNLFYWGDKAGDEVAAQAAWQAAEYGRLKRAHLLPDRKGPDFKRQIMAAIDSPVPVPVGILYFFCHCSVGNGSKPCLRFGNTSKKEDTLERADLSMTALTDAPLVFANACSTAQADPSMASELESSFFDRGIRGFVGTENKVPTWLASKFAWLYFQFLYRLADPGQQPMSAGEALTQARIFLLTQYKNIGGLFYCMTNQYDLYLASESEILALRN